MALAVVSEATVDQVAYGSNHMATSVSTENEADLAFLTVLSSQSPKMGRQRLSASSSSSSAMGETSRPILGQESKATDLQQHLQAMFAILEPPHLLKEVVKLESTHNGRIRYLAVVACAGSKEADEEEACLLGFDCVADRTTLGLVLRIYADTFVTLDGDGGFSLCTSGSQHIFKPVSVHTLWAVLQTLHKACNRARRYNHYAGGGTHRWAESYEQRINSDRSCLNEWHLLPDVESRRPPSPDQLLKPRQRAETELLIRSTLKEVMMVLDLDVVTSKDIRKKVEDDLGLDLTSYKSFIDEEMLTILGQMDGASQVFDHVYLGSEWNAANLEELQRNGVGHILNVTREIDNFFPGQFDYLNIRVYDDEATELLKHWDRTFKFITRAVDSGSKVLVHCKMGVSRSASVVVAYAMKAYDWDLPKALEHVKFRRSCVKPNASFMEQLKIYAGILDASRQRHNKLWRSKSESNLKHEARGSTADGSSSSTTVLIHSQPSSGPLPPTIPIQTNSSSDRLDGGGSPTSPSRVLIPAGLTAGDSPISDSLPSDNALNANNSSVQTPTHVSIDSCGHGTLSDVPDGNRPKSWSPEDTVAESFFPTTPRAVDGHENCCDSRVTDPDSVQSCRTVGVSLRVPCSNGRTYSVSQNRAVQLEFSPPPPPPLPSFSIGETDDCASPPLSAANRDEYEDRRHFSLERNASTSNSDWLSSMDLMECVNNVLLSHTWSDDSSIPSLPNNDTNSLPRVGSVKDRIYELEAAAAVQPLNPNSWRPSSSVANANVPLATQDSNRPDRTGLVLNLASHFGTVASSTVNSTPENDTLSGDVVQATNLDVEPAFPWFGSNSEVEGPVVSQIKTAPARHQAVLVRLQQEEKQQNKQDGKQPTKPGDPFSVHVDRVFDCEERTLPREIPLRQHSWGPAESRSTREGSSLPYVMGSMEVPAVADTGSSSVSITSYASDPSLSGSSAPRPLTLIHGNSRFASALSLLEFDGDLCLPKSATPAKPTSVTTPQTAAGTQSTSPPPGVVRMQLEALESQQRLHRTAGPLARRSLPDEIHSSAGTVALKCKTAIVHTQQTQSVALNRNATELTAPLSGGSVSRLRKELEAKAVSPLTGSVAPHPSVVAAVESGQQGKSTSTRVPLSALRKRSLSVDKMNYRGLPSGKTGSNSEPAGSPSPPAVPRRPNTPQSTANVATRDGEIDVDLNVKLLVEQFEAPRFDLRQRGFSESSVINNSSHLSSSSSSASSTTSSSSRPSSVPPVILVPPPPRQPIPSSKVLSSVNCLMSPTPNADRPISVVAVSPVASKPPVPAPCDQPSLPPVAAPRHNRKFHGKTHPLDRLASRQRHAHPVFGTM